MHANNFSIIIHLEPQHTTSYLFNTFPTNELLPTKSFTAAGSLINAKIFIADNQILVTKIMMSFKKTKTAKQEKSFPKYSYS